MVLIKIFSYSFIPNVDISGETWILSSFSATKFKILGINANFLWIFYYCFFLWGGERIACVEGMGNTKTNLRVIHILHMALRQSYLLHLVLHNTAESHSELVEEGKVFRRILESKA